MKALLERPDALPDIVALINDLLRLKHSVQVQVGSDDGPYYDAEVEIVTMPYQFALDIEARFSKHGNPSRVDLTALDDIVIDVVMHTLFHELGHVLMAQYRLPLFFEEEDVVDSLANMLLLEYTNNGAVIATSAAEMFLLEHAGLDEFEASDFWGEHSLDIQRHFDIYCGIYASEPDSNDYLIDDIFDGDEDQADSCFDTYERIRLSWEPLLQPILR